MYSGIVKTLKSGGVGVLPTDTIYGLVGSALSRKTVFRIYKLRKRNPQKPFIVLISSFEDLKLFKIKVDGFTQRALKKIWPNSVSVILPCPGKKFFYLHRRNNTLAFRFPKNKKLIKLLEQTGPLVAPSVNPERMPPAENIGQAKKYFGNRIDFYVDAGRINGPASTLIEIKNKRINIIRQGKIKIKT
jgi:L-threonylcarbamoyladenylate synthase